MTNRVVAWFSCGAASAVAAKLAVEEYGDRVVVAYCDTMEAEHPDNRRFFRDVERWIGQPIMRLTGRYETVDEVFAKTQYMAGVRGARCTAEMKKRPRLEFEQPDDIHIFGFTADEGKRIERFTENNWEMSLDFILQRLGISKADCLETLRYNGIATPAMYDLGYNNNNCLGCVKATSAKYWNMVRRDFPDVFEKRARQSEELGVRLTRVKGERVFLSQLPADYLPAEELEDISCGPDCGVPW